MEFGILSAEPSGSFHDEEVVERGGSQAWVWGKGLKGRWVSHYSRPRPFPLASELGVWKPELSRRPVCTVAGAWRLPPPPLCTAVEAWAATRDALLCFASPDASSSGSPGGSGDARGGVVRTPAALQEGLATGREGWRFVLALAAVVLLEDFPVTIVGLLLVLILKPSDLFHGGARERGEGGDKLGYDYYS